MVRSGMARQVVFLAVMAAMLGKLVAACPVGLAGWADGTYTVPQNVMNIPDGLFDDCASLTEVNFANAAELTSIGYAAFQKCIGLTEINFTNAAKLESIENKAFYSCTKLETINFANAIELTSIGESPSETGGAYAGAFNYCDKLKTANFANTAKLKTIGDYAFSYTALTEINFGNVAKLETIGTYAFAGNHGNAGPPLKTVNFENAAELTSIGNKAFYDCYELETVNFAGAVKLQSIGSGAFLGCAKLHTVDFQHADNLTMIGADAFTQSCLQDVVAKQKRCTCAGGEAPICTSGEACSAATNKTCPDGYEPAPNSPVCAADPCVYLDFSSTGTCCQACTNVAYGATFDENTCTVANCANNYGPNAGKDACVENQCVRPVDVTAYNITETNLGGPTFNVTLACKAGYTSVDPKAQVCTDNGTAYTVTNPCVQIDLGGASASHSSTWAWVFSGILVSVFTVSSSLT